MKNKYIIIFDLDATFFQMTYFSQYLFFLFHFFDTTPHGFIV